MQLTGSAEDLVSRYRSELAVRAKRCKNGPTGALITRRSTAKGSVSEKFAADCYLMYQFINGNTSDISELFKPQQGIIPSRLNSTCIGDDNAPTLKSEITLMKETMTQLLTDVNLLKTNITQTQETLNTVSDSLKKDISCIKLELDACKLKCTQTINTEKYPKAAQSTCLADKLSHIGWMITRLDNSRILLEQKSRDLERCISDNSMGLSELRDRETSGNNALKCQIRDIRENVEEFKESTNAKVSTDSDTMYADISKRFKSIEKRVDEPKSSKLESSFNDLSKTVSFKIDKLCSVVEQALVNRPSIQFHENLHRDGSTGKFVRLPQNELNDSTANQRIANNALPISADTSQHNNSSSVANKSFVATPLYSTLAKHMPPNSTTGALMHSNTGSERDINSRSDCTASTGSSERTADTSLMSTVKSTAVSKEKDKSESRYSNPIPVVNTSGQHDGRFKGVIRRKAKTYFLSGIDPDSNE